VTAAPNLAHAAAEKRILVCVGSGGVGKTTTAAALALAAARRGRKTLVITIDPARRLANSLGLDALGHDIKRVDPALVLAGAARPGGSLSAMMLDQKKAFDEVVARHAKDPAAVGRILGNPIYAQISGTLAGAHEYAAMAKLQELDATGTWDLIVIDTPPTAHALDFLDAPEKLTAAIDSPAIEWFRKLQGGAKSGWSVVGRTGSFILKRLAKFVGSQFLDDLAIFFTEFNDVLGGFKQRAEETMALLHQPKVGFVLVASPEPMAVQEALFFHERLVRASMPFTGFVVNRVHPSRPVSADRAAVEKLLAHAPSVAALGLSGTSLRMAADALVAAHTDLEVLATADQASIARLAKAEGPGSVLVQVPFLREDVHDIARLVDLGRYLVGA
jgi:anion-transporting  ArsA/GET3 family ATPase